jgi:bifunctional non-homologous end joining protein LigD
VPSRGSDRGSAEHPTLIDVGEATSALPRALVPMRPRLARQAFNSPEYVFELKWDGVRALAARDAAGLRVTDRTGGDLLPAVPELRELRVPDGMVLDGEIVVCDSRGRPSYDLLAGRALRGPLRVRGPLPPGPLPPAAKAAKRGRGPIFVAFDLLYADGRPLISRPLAERRARLLGAGLGSRILAVPEHLDDDGEPFLEVVAEYGLEGIVAKRRDGRYVPGTRTADWLKCHVTPRADVVVGALVIDEHRGARTLLCGLRGEEGAIAFAGDAYVPPYLGEWLDVATRGFAADSSPFATPVALRTGLRFLRPRLVAIVEYAGLENGELRDARFRALRLDGHLDDCRRDEPVEVPSYPPHTTSDRPRLIVLNSLPFPVS